MPRRGSRVQIPFPAPVFTLPQPDNFLWMSVLGIRLSPAGGVLFSSIKQAAEGLCGMAHVTPKVFRSAKKGRFSMRCVLPTSGSHVPSNLRAPWPWRRSRGVRRNCYAKRVAVVLTEGIVEPSHGAAERARSGVQSVKICIDGCYKVGLLRVCNRPTCSAACARSSAVSGVLLNRPR